MNMFYSLDDWRALGPTRRQNLFAELKAREQQVVTRIYKFLEDFHRQEENELFHLVRYHQFRSIPISEALKWPRILQDKNETDPEDPLPIIFMMKSSEAILDENKLAHLEDLLHHDVVLLKSCEAELPASAVQLEIESQTDMPELHRGQQLEIIKLMDPLLLSYVCKDFYQEVRQQPKFCEHLSIECNDTGEMTCTTYNHDFRKQMEIRRQVVRDIMLADDDEAMKRLVHKFITGEKKPKKSDIIRSVVQCPCLNPAKNEQIVKKHEEIFDVTSESSCSSLSEMLAKLHVYSIELDISSDHMEIFMKHAPYEWRNKVQRVQGTQDCLQFAATCPHMTSLDIEFDHLEETHTELIHTCIEQVEYIEEFGIMKRNGTRMYMLSAPWSYSDSLVLLASKSRNSPNGLRALNFPLPVSSSAVMQFLKSVKLDSQAKIESLVIKERQGDDWKKGLEMINWHTEGTDGPSGISMVIEGDHISEAGVVIKVRYYVVPPIRV